MNLHRRPLAGDQLYVELDLSPANLPAGTRLAVGSAVIEITGQPHLGCAKFAARFGHDAWRFVNSGSAGSCGSAASMRELSAPERSAQATRSANCPLIEEIVSRSPTLTRLRDYGEGWRGSPR